MIFLVGIRNKGWEIAAEYIEAAILSMRKAGYEIAMHSASSLSCPVSAP